MAGGTGSTRTSWKRVVLVIIAIILAFSLLSMACSAVIFRMIFERGGPVDHTLHLTYADLDSGRYPRQEISFPSGEHTLRGYWYPAQGSEGVVIIAHGLNSDAHGHLAEAVYFLDHGLSVFTYDGTGVGDSEGKSVVGLTQSKRDVQAAVACVKEHCATLPVFLYGHSMGGYGVLAALEAVEVDAAVCLSGFSSPVGLMYHSAKERVGILADLEYPFLWLQNYFVFGTDARADAAEIAGNSNVPVLVIYGSEDAVIPPPVLLDEGNITGENVTVKAVTEAGRSGHSGLWLSAEAAEYYRLLARELEALSFEYGGDIPDGILSDFLAGVDKEKISRLDGPLMDSILQFYLTA